MRLIRSFLYVIWSLVYSFWFVAVSITSLFFFIPFFFFRMIGLKGLASRYGSKMAKVASWAYLLGDFCWVEVKGRENIPKDKKLVVVGNHQGYCDVMIMVLSLPFCVGFIAKRELFYVPIVSFWLRVLNCVPINRKSPRDSIRAILEGIAHVEKGLPMIIFPEGTRSHSNKMRPFKAGSFKLAFKPGATILPVTIDGTYKLVEEFKLISPFHKIRVTIHPAIDTTQLSKEEQAELPERISAQINSGLRHPNTEFLPPRIMK